MKTKKDLSLYIHIPFCKRKCRYCDFFSAPASLKEQEEYVDHLVDSIKKQASEYADYQVISIFFGGGTPSILSGEEMTKIMDSIKESFDISDLAEVTIEVNPGTVSLEKWNIYHKLGINRASIGLQSANNEELALLGRIHTYEEFLQCFQDARKAGFTNLNVDLISSLPGQTKESYLDTLNKVILLEPEHISAYSLILEENTAFYKMFFDESGNEKTYVLDGKEYSLLSEDEDREIYHLTKKVLEKNGYDRYEISNYAKPGKECRHNMVYWRRGNYLGLGAGAASLIGNIRFSNDHVYPFNKINQEILSEEDEMAEFMFLGLRTMEGVSMEQFETLFHKKMEVVYGRQLKKLQEEKCIMMKQKSIQERTVSLTEMGLDVSNYAMAEFL